MGRTSRKAELLKELRSARSEWDELVSKVPDELMSEPGAAGYWSVKDIIAHLAAVDRWFVDALQAQLRGEPPPNPEEQMLELEERNRLHFERNRKRPIHDILAESRQVFEQLIGLVEAQSDRFLFETQAFENMPEPVVPGKALKEACADHYSHHIPSVREWLSKSTGHS